MAPSEHITWFEDNLKWFELLTAEQLSLPVPSCPGWSIVNVVNHLSYGLALGYPVAMSKPPDTPDVRAFDGVSWPDEHPTGKDALIVFSTNMATCSRRFQTDDPDRRCWTYDGPGTAAFWFRRAAIETTLHRMDVAEALDTTVRHLNKERAADAIEETLGFALPLAGAWTTPPSDELAVESPCLERPATTGAGTTRATISGEPHDVLNALWGRHRDRVTITGDTAIANQWLSLIEVAFAGR